MRARIKWIVGGLFTLMVALIGGPIFTTDFNDAAAHGKTWTVAIHDRFAELWPYLTHLLTSTVILWPTSIVVAFATGWCIAALIHQNERASYSEIADRMDNLGSSIRYHFEYGPSAAFGDGRGLLSELHAFTITLNRQGFRTPPHGNDAAGWMKIMEAMFTALVPYLRDKHIAQAKEMAARYTAEQCAA